MPAWRVPGADPENRGVDSWSMSGETTVESHPHESAFGSISEQPWMPAPQFYIPQSANGPVPMEPVSEVPLDASSPEETRVVLGLDYGTTYTGLAFMHQVVDHVVNTEELHVFTEWGDGRGAGKIPSAISYSKSPTGRQQWGMDIDKNKSLVLQWTKLDLPPQTPIQELSRLRKALAGISLLQSLKQGERNGERPEIPQHLSKSPSKIVHDYLSRVARQYYLHMRGNNEFAIGIGNVPVDMVITHPAGWPYEATNKTFRAAMSAFDKKKFPTRRNVYLVPEPEACAVFTIRDMIDSGRNTMVPGDCFVVCDAGGGTVDLVTYCVEQLEPLELRKIGYISGAMCGATYIDRAFLSWIEPKLTQADGTPVVSSQEGHFVLHPKGNTILSRFEAFKREFKGSGSNILTLPGGIKVDPGFTQCTTDLLTINEDDMKGFFSFSVDKTVELIEQQVVHAEIEGMFVSHVFMSGGMSQSDYLFQKVCDWAAKHPGSIQVQRPQDGWTAVVRGSVLCGMGIGVHNAVLTKSCRRHYGVAGAELLGPWKHRAVDVHIVADEIHGANMALDQIRWLVNKGDVLIPHVPIEASCRVACTFKRQHLVNASTVWVTFCATESEEAPTHNLDKESNEVAVMEIRLGTIPPSALQSKRTARDEEFLKAILEVKMVVDFDDRVQVRVMCEGKQLAGYSTRT